ncbi:C40 family peptidase [Cronobacter muytjensii]|nr:C40 family peptidase [Cronobacter muytjensii]
MDENLIHEIKRHAAQSYPQECCGLICQQGDRLRYIPCENTATDPAEHFRIAPEDYARAEDQGNVVGIVHSHPDATSQPSELDRAQCDVTELPWHIVSWPEGDFRTIYPRGELPLIGRPFVLGVYDCWGLIMSYFRQEHGIELHDYRVDYHWWEAGHTENFYQDCWYECGFREFDGPPKPGDMVIMQVSAPRWNHAGILLEGNMLLHHLYGHQSGRTPYGGYWRERTMKIVRHKDLMGEA